MRLTVRVDAPAIVISEGNPMKIKFVPGILGAACLFFLSAGALPAAVLQTLSGHVPAMVSRLSAVGDLPGTNRLQLAIGLPLRHQDVLTQLLRDIADPASPRYRHYLKPGEFAAQFGPAESDYEALKTFAVAQGLQVVGTHSNHMILDVAGAAADVQRALNVHLKVYRHPTESRTFYAPVNEPSLALTNRILRIAGLNNFARPHPHMKATPLGKGPAGPAGTNYGSAVAGLYEGYDFRNAYLPGVTLTGAGQSVALVEFDGYTPADIIGYESQAGLPVVPLENIYIDGASGLPSGTGGEIEAALDIEVAVAMAPGLSKVIVYEILNTDSGNTFDDGLSRIADDDLARQISCSWYIPDGPADPVADAIFQQMAAQGQTFFTAEGDADAYSGLIPFPCDSPYLTTVGGTELFTSGPRGYRTGESVWNSGGGIGTGGGISTQYAIPAWQTNLSMLANHGSVTMRNNPDVALCAFNVFTLADNIDFGLEGTSCAAPLWAGFAALCNQQAANSGNPPIGFINPALDRLGSGANYTLDFNDITSGNNAWSGSPTNFPAVTGFDLCTGWGTPAGQGLINGLAYTMPLVVTPATGFTAIGGVGGPFSTSSMTFTLTNAGTDAISWSLSNTSAWLNVSAAGGMLTSGGSATTVTASLTDTAAALPLGTYSATLAFTNVATGNVQTRPFILSVISQPTITTQPVSQSVLEGSVATFAVNVAGGLPLFYQWQDNGTNLTDGGNLTGSATASLVISNIAAASTGAYTVVVSNYAGAVTSTAAWLSLNASAPVIATQPLSQSVSQYGSVTFSVVANGTTPYFYQWNFNGTNLPGATNQSLTLTNLQLGQTGDYAVTVTNIYGSALSSNAVLFVGAVPAILTQPASQSVAEGGTATFSVTAGGAPPLFYQWKVNGTVLSGATNATLVVTNADLLANAGTYAVLVTSAYGSVLSSNATLTVQEAPFLDNQLNNTNLPAGSGNVFAIFAGGSTPLSYQWTFNDAVIAGATNYFINQTNVQLYQAGTYVVTVTNLYGSISSTGTLSVYTVAPSITTQPTNQTLAVGATANIAVVAAGTKPLGYQWSLNGSPVLNATNPTLTMTGLQLSQSGGVYAVTVTNLYGTVTSSNATLTVYSSAPFFVTQPTNSTVSVGGVVVLSATLGGTLPISYQWKLNGTNPPGSTALTVVLRNMQPSEAGTAVLTATNVYGTAVSTNVTITVLTTPPSITTQPGNQSVNPGSTASFSVTAAGTAPLSYQWTQNGTNLTGATGSSLSVPNVQLPQTGNYAVTVSSPYGPSVTSSNAVLSISSAPVITASPASENAAQGGTATFTVTAGGAPPLAYQWTFNGTNLAFGTNATLSLPDVQTNQAGWYAVYVTNLYGSALSVGAYLSVYQAPVITGQPANETVFVKGTAVLAVTATGSTPLAYQWQFNGTNLAKATGSTLTLTNVQTAQAGYYDVLITNVVGTVTSSNALLTVNPLDHFDWSSLATPQFVNRPFAVTLLAKDPTDTTITNFTGTVLLGATNGTTVSPAVSGSFVQGAWSGNLTVSQFSPGLVLSASDGLGHTGLASLIAVEQIPSLSLHPSGTNLLLLWPASATGFGLEYTGNLAPAVWVPVTNVPAQVGGQLELPVPVTATNRFYRLVYPAP